MESLEPPDWRNRGSDPGERWQALFADLEGQLAAGSAADLAAEVADRTRREVGALRLLDRLRPVLGSRLTVRLLGGGCIEGRLDSAGPGWLLVAGPGQRETLVLASGLSAVSGLVARSEVVRDHVANRLTVGHALRAIARSRAPVAVALVDGQTLSGVLDRVGADFVELAPAPAGEHRRTPGTATLTVPLSSVAVVRRGG